MLTATIQQVIDHLEKSFKPEAKLCYLHCVEGKELELKLVPKDALGMHFFYSAAKLKEDDADN